MNRIFKNTSSLFSAHLISRLGSLVITIWLMPRYFSESELGGYFVAIALTNLIASLTELGMQNPLIREMTLHLQQTRHYLGNALIVRGILSIIAYGIMIVSGIFLYAPIIVNMIIFLGLAEIANSLAQLYRCVFRAHEEMKYEAFTVIAERGVFLAIGGGAILFDYGLVTVCQAMLAAGCMNLILSVGLTRYRFTELRFQPSREIVTTLMQQALPFAIGNLFNLLYFRVDAIMVSKLSSEGVDANTWYGLAYTIVNAFTILPGAFMMGAMFPVLSRGMGTREREISVGIHIRYAVDGTERTPIGGWVVNTVSRNYNSVVPDLHTGRSKQSGKSTSMAQLGRWTYLRNDGGAGGASGDR